MIIHKILFHAIDNGSTVVQVFLLSFLFFPFHLLVFLFLFFPFLRFPFPIISLPFISFLFSYSFLFFWQFFLFFPFLLIVFLLLFYVSHSFPIHFLLFFSFLSVLLLVFLLLVFFPILSFLDPQLWAEGYYELGSVCLSSVLLSWSFLGIGSLVFSESQYGVRGLYGVVRNSQIFLKKFLSPKWSKSRVLNLLENLVINFFWIWSIKKVYVFCCILA